MAITLNGRGYRSRRLRRLYVLWPNNDFVYIVNKIVASVYCYFVLFLLLLYDTVCEVYK